MVHHLVLCRLQDHVQDERVEWIMRQTRIHLLKIDEVRGIHCGKKIDPHNHWGFFFAAEYESLAKMALGHDNPVYGSFLSEVIAPNVAEQLAMSYECDPGVDVRYS